jgi:uncharacterized protein
VSGKTTDFLTTESPEGEDVSVPVGIVDGASGGPVLLVVAGVHGSEYDGIEAAKRLLKWVEPSQLAGKLIVVPCLNIPAFYGLAAHVNPIDGVNPGRAFPGDPEGSHTERMTALIWPFAESADYIVDVHGGDLEEELVEYSQINLTEVEEVDRKADALARALDMPYLVRKPKQGDLPTSGSSLHSVAAAHGKPAVLSEAGSHGELDQRTTEIHLNALKNALNHLGMIEGSPTRDHPEPQVLHRFTGVQAPAEGFWYPSVAKGDTVSAGQVVGDMRTIFDEPLAEVVSDEDAVVLGVISTPARRSGDLLLGLGTLS